MRHNGLREAVGARCVRSERIKTVLPPALGGGGVDVAGSKDRDRLLSALRRVQTGAALAGARVQAKPRSG